MEGHRRANRDVGMTEGRLSYFISVCLGIYFLPDSPKELVPVLVDQVRLVTSLGIPPGVDTFLLWYDV